MNLFLISMFQEIFNGKLKTQSKLFLLLKFLCQKFRISQDLNSQNLIGWIWGGAEGLEIITIGYIL